MFSTDINVLPKKASRVRRLRVIDRSRCKPPLRHERTLADSRDMQSRVPMSHDRPPAPEYDEYKVIPARAFIPKSSRPIIRRIRFSFMNH